MTVVDNLIIQNSKFKTINLKKLKIIHKRIKNISYEKIKNTFEKIKNTFEYVNKYYKSKTFNEITKKKSNILNNNNIQLYKSYYDKKYSGITLFNMKKDDIESLQIVIGGTTIYYAKYNILKKMNLINTINNNIVITFPFTVILPRVSFQIHNIIIKTKNNKSFSYELNELINKIVFSNKPIDNVYNRNLFYQKFTDYSIIKCINNTDENFFRTKRELFIIPLSTKTIVTINEKTFNIHKSLEKVSLGFYEGYVNITIKGYVYIYYEFDNYYIYDKISGLSGVFKTSDNYYVNNLNNLNVYNININKSAESADSADSADSTKSNNINHKIKITNDYIYTNDVSHFKYHKSSFLKNKSGYLCKYDRTEDGITFTYHNKSYYIDKYSVLITQFGNCGSTGKVVYKSDKSTQSVSIGGIITQHKKEIDDHDKKDDDGVPEHPIENIESKYDEPLKTDGFFGYKSCYSNNINIIVKLFIKNTNSVAKSLTEIKMRTEEAYVVDAWKIINNELVKCDITDEIYSIHDKSFKYVIGSSVVPTNGYSNKLDVVCVPGIHFFMSPILALKYTSQIIPVNINLLDL